MAEIIDLKDALLTMPNRPAFDGYDEQGNELSVDVYLLKLLLQDGRVYYHPFMGKKADVAALEEKMQASGRINLGYWHRARKKQDY